MCAIMDSMQINSSEYSISDAFKLKNLYQMNMMHIIRCTASWCIQIKIWLTPICFALRRDITYFQNWLLLQISIMHSIIGNIILCILFNFELYRHITEMIFIYKVHNCWFIHKYNTQIIYHSKQLLYRSI